MRPFVKDMVRVAVLTEPANSWPTYDFSNLKRHDYVTASEASYCVRRLSFQKTHEKGTVQVPDYWERMSDEEFNEKLSAMGDDDKLGIFARGHHIEEWLTNKIVSQLAYDEDLLFYGSGQLSFHLRDMQVSGTPDGLYIDMKAKTIVILEIKSADTRVTAPREAHERQLKTNMGIVSELIKRGELYNVQGYDLNDYKVVGGTLVYINPSNFLTMDEFVFDHDPETDLAPAIVKAAALFDKDGGIIAPEELPPEGLEKWGGCNFCPFQVQCMWIEEKQEHEERAAKLVKMIQTGSDKVIPAMPLFALDAKAEKEDILKVIADYDAFNKAEKDAKSHKEALKASIVEWVKTQPKTKVEFEDNGRLFKVSLSSSERAGSLDAEHLAAFLAKHDESLEKFRKGPSKVETLLVSVKVA